MAAKVIELEGTWEEIMAHAAELAGRRVRLTVLAHDPQDSARGASLPADNQRMLELLAEWERTPLTAEERATLEGLEQHLKEQPFSLRQLDDTP